MCWLAESLSSSTDITVCVKWTGSKGNAEGRRPLKPSRKISSRKCFESRLLFLLLPKASFLRPSFCSTGDVNGRCVEKWQFSYLKLTELWFSSCCNNWNIGNDKLGLWILLWHRAFVGLSLNPLFLLDLLVSSQLCSHLVFVFGGNILHADCVARTFPWILMCFYSLGVVVMENNSRCSAVPVDRFQSFIQLNQTISC